MIIADMLAEAEKINKERHEVYKLGYEVHGQVMKVLFPDGLRLKTAEDFTRFYLFDNIVAKLVRVTTNLDHLHKDSILDLGVYAFMLAQYDKDHVIRSHQNEIPNSFIISFPTSIPQEFIEKMLQQWSLFKPTITPAPK